MNFSAIPKSILNSAIMGCFCLALVACGGGSGTGSDTIALTVSVNAPSGITLAEGDQFYLVANFSGTGAADVDATNVEWASSDDSVLSIFANGKLARITAVGSGSATVTATYETTSSNAISVNAFAAGDCTVNSVGISGNTSVEEGDQASLLLTALCAEGGQRVASSDVAWETSNSLVATVDASGVLTAVGAGTSTITATYSGQSDQYTVTVTAAECVSDCEEETNDLTALSVSVATPSFAYPYDFCPGKSLTYTVTGTYENGSTADITSDVMVSTSSAAMDLSTAGVLAANSAGEAAVTYALDGVETVESYTVSACGVTYFFQKPSTWGTPRIYAFIEGGEPDLVGSWDDSPNMTSDGEDWYRYFIESTDNDLRVIFRDGSNQTANLNRTATGWCTVNGASTGTSVQCTWSDTDPRAQASITLSPSTGTFSDTLTVGIEYAGAGYDSCKYTTDGGNPIALGTDCTSSVGPLGASLGNGETIVFQVCISSASDDHCEQKIYTKSTVSLPDATFTWDNATIYFVMTDRFNNGDTSNDKAYNESNSILGRQLSTDATAFENASGQNLPDWGTFHGGDLKGLTEKLDYIASLGVNAIWLTSPLEQIHGWVQGYECDACEEPSFRHYGYHGYYPLDFTKIDENMGTADDFRDFVDGAHERGLRVIMDIVMNHVGYFNHYDLDKFGVDVLYDGYASDTDLLNTYHDYIHYEGHPKVGNWSDWWGTSWIRMGISGSGYDAGDDENALTQGLSFLPDFKTESTQDVPGLPPFYQNKPSTAATEIPGGTVRNHLITWLTDWVEEYGIDAFRCDTVKHVEEEAWRELKQAGVDALRTWKSNNPSKKLDDLDFWMVGEVFDYFPFREDAAFFTRGWYGSGRNGPIDFHSTAGFDSVINFEFQDAVIDNNWGDNVCGVMGSYSTYADQINNSPKNLLSYLSSHDTKLYWNGSATRQKNAGTVLMMLPGGVQIFYGDEYGREALDVADDILATRSDMDFSTRDDVRSHWQALGQFRVNHPSVGAGSHQVIGASSGCGFSRSYNGDKVAVVMGASGTVSASVSGVFDNGAEVRNAYNGVTATVNNGSVSFDAGSNGVILIESAN